MSDSERLEQLEQAVRALQQETEALRAEVRRLAPWSGPAPAPPRPTPAASSQPTARPTPQSTSRVTPRPSRISGVFPELPALDLETLVGRYGAMAIASLLVIMGIGALLRWAAVHGFLGPEMRVVLGGLAALAVGATGWWLRGRGAQRFGDTLLALALALVHVDAWGAGPYLQIIPEPVALLIAAAASVALAALALADGHQTLFAVGVGGALLAPFVTSRDSGHVMALLAYGWVVIAVGLVALRGRDWRVASQLLAGGCGTYTVAALTATAGGAGLPWPRADAPALFALVCAAAAFLWGGAVQRTRFTFQYLGLALLALLVGVADRTNPLDLVPLAAAATLTTYLMLGPRQPHRLIWLVAALALPLGFLVAALGALDDSGLRAAALAAVWALIAVAASIPSSEAGERRSAHLTVSAVSSAGAVAFALHTRPEWCIAALAAHAALWALVVRRERSPMLLVPVIAVLLIASGWAYSRLEARPLYGYTPFATAASLAALSAVAGWAAVTWAARVTAWPTRPDESSAIPDRTAAMALVALLAWGRSELARAYSADVAMFALILFYASLGVAAILVGRRRGVAALRQVGLALAIYAALKAVAQASTVALIGLRVGSYLLVGCFLLAVAYWYRAAGEPSVAPSPTTLDTRTEAGD